LSVYFIAEAGVNHNGDIGQALALIDAAKGAGADAVKFQSFNANLLVTADAPKAAYQKKTAGAEESQIDMLRRLQLDEDDQRLLYRHCQDRDIDFLSSPFDHESLRFLVEQLGLQTIKVPSGEITNGPLLLEIAARQCTVILSTGASTLDEVGAALSVLAFGYLALDAEPSIKAFAEAFATDEGRKQVSEKVTLLHCTSEYPAPIEDANLRCMDTMTEAFSTPVGLSDHTQDQIVALAAAARGAAIIEKHFTLGRGLPGPDHQSSVEPDALAELISAIRRVETILGSPEKKPAPSEGANRGVIRKSLVAARDIDRGRDISADDLTAMRPGTGVSPMEYWQYIGRPAAADFRSGEVLKK
jgi:N-acetylneuraminate synthase